MIASIRKDPQSCHHAASVITQRIGMAVADVRGNMDKKNDNPESGFRITRKDAKTNNIGSSITELFPELLGSVMAEAIAAKIAFHMKIPISVNGIKSRMVGKCMNCRIVPIDDPVNCR